jgi:hypothetical protein
MAVRRLATDRPALTATMHEDCRCYDCDTIDALLGDIAHYWDLNENELTQLLHRRRIAGKRL